MTILFFWWFKKNSFCEGKSSCSLIQSNIDLIWFLIFFINGWKSKTCILGVRGCSRLDIIPVGVFYDSFPYTRVLILTHHFLINTPLSFPHYSLLFITQHTFSMSPYEVASLKSVDGSYPAVIKYFINDDCWIPTLSYVEIAWWI